MRIVIAPDSFKASASAHDVAHHIATGIREVLSNDTEIILHPMSDGGEGTSALFAGERITLPTTDALGRITEATYTYDARNEIAYIDVAAASGLKEVGDHLSPLTADTFGTGALIADAASRGAKRLILGLGGSATTDGGTGILTALGANFLDANGHSLPPGGAALKRLASVDISRLNLQAAAMDMLMLADVVTPATGPDGTSAVYAPRKGASAEDVNELEAGISQLCKVLNVNPEIPGMGAAGGVPICLTWISTTLHGGTDNIRLVPGARVIVDVTGLKDEIADADVVITGEGCYDSDTGMGKVVSVVLGLNPQAKQFVVAGRIDGPLPEGVRGITLINSNDVKKQLVRAGNKIAEQLIRD